MPWGPAIGAVGALGASAISSSNSGGQTVDKRPWEEMIPFLLHDQGIFPEAKNQYTHQQNAWDTQYAPTVDAYADLLRNRGNNDIYRNANQMSQDMMGGKYDSTGRAIDWLDPNLGQAAPVRALMESAWGPSISGASKVAAPVVNAPERLNSQNVNITDARRTQGAADPTNALKSLLSGQINNPYLGQQANAITSDITRNLQENILPGMRDSAVAAGQYGGSRQGILESKALSNVSRDTASALSGLFGGAYENAQSRMQGTAGQLNDQAGNLAVNNAGRADAAGQFNIGNAFDASKFNANNALDTSKFNANNEFSMQQFNSNNANRGIDRNLDVNKFNTTSGINQNQFNSGNALNVGQFNANLGLRNNDQQQNFNQQNLQNRTSGLGLFNQVGNAQDQNFQSSFNTLGARDKYRQGNLNNYANLVLQGSGMGGTTATGGGGSDVASQMFGGALAGGQLYNLWDQKSGGGNGGFSGNPSNMNQLLQMNGNDYGKFLSGMGG